MRIQDAVPDELEIIPDGGESKHSPGHIHPDTSPAAATKPIPKTVVQKVIPATPSHGEVPGTAAHSIRKADAVPDVVVQVTDPDFSSFQAHSKSNPAVGSVLETTNAGQESISSNNGGVGEAGSNTRSGFEGLDSEEGESEIPGKYRIRPEAFQRAIDGGQIYQHLRSIDPHFPQPRIQDH